MTELSDAELLDLAHTRLTFNAPMGMWRVNEIADRLDVRPDTSVLDLGCGDGELLLHLCARAGSGIGVDLDERAIERGSRNAADRGLSERVSFTVADVATWSQPADITVAVGAMHAWGGHADALAALAALTHPSGRLVYGDGVWQGAPTDAAVTLFGDLPDLGSLLDIAADAGWRVLYASEATQHELDVWESDWRAGLALSGQPDAWALAEERRREYFSVYRGVLGFAWLVLLRP